METVHFYWGGSIGTVGFFVISLLVGAAVGYARSRLPLEGRFAPSHDGARGGTQASPTPVSLGRGLAASEERQAA